MTTSITQNWQARLVERDTLIGAGTSYPGIGGIEGLGVLEPQNNDVERYGDGDAFGRDRLGARTIIIPVKVTGATDATMWANYRALAVGWRRSQSELALDLRIPGSAETVVRYYGRPNGLDGDPHGLKGALVTAAEFRAGPYCYGAEHTDSALVAATPLVLAAAGDLDTPSDRATLTITGNGGTPTVTNTTTGGTLVFTQTLAGAATYIVDLHAQTVSKAGISVPSHLTATSDWFELAGGVANSLAFSGCASISILWRPAFQVP